MSKQLRALILTEGSALWGMGHLFRCSAYAEELESRGWMVEWRILGDSRVDAFLRGRRGVQTDWRDIENAGTGGADLVLLDSYHAPEEVYRAVVLQAPFSISLDDEARLSYPTTLVVNSAPGAEKLPYKLSDDVRLLAGPHYHPLRSEFVANFSRIVSSRVNRILVLMGGTDPKGVGPLAAKVAIEAFPQAATRMLVTDESQRQKWAALESQNLTLVGGLSAAGIRAEMEEADLCISAAGQTLYEACRLGLPTVAIGVAENQRFNMAGFDREGAVIPAGWWDDPKLPTLLSGAMTVVRSRELREGLRDRGRTLVDGQGVRRVLESLPLPS